MALSVRKFNHALTCPEPENQVSVNYHPTSATELCNGNGTLTALFSDVSNTLMGIQAGDDSPNAGESGLCAQGMDVVFLVDYTFSMDNAINGVKTGISSLVDAISTESGGNYRLGLVLYDEASSSSPAYADSGYYQGASGALNGGIPADQKITVASPDESGYTLFTTCVEKMDSVGNETSFTSNLGAIATSNSNSGMRLGSGGDYDEPAGRALYEILANDFAGTFRSGVQKLIILITDNITSESDTYWQQTITPALNSAGAQLMVQVDPVNSDVNSTSMAGSYTYATANTQPQGYYDYTVSFNNELWTGGLELAISNLCQETFTYTCETPAVGWYQEVGQHVAYYYDGSSWTSEHTCQYTVTINLIDDVSNGGISNISTSHPYYSDANTYSITGIPGTTFNDIINDVTTPTDYTFVDIENITIVRVGGGSNIASLQSYTDDGNGNSGLDELLTEIQFKLSGEIPYESVTYNVTISGRNIVSQYSLIIDVIGDEVTGPGSGIGDTLDAEGATQSPAGYTYVNPVLPASGWQDVGATYYRSAYRYTFTGPVNSSHSLDVEFTSNPTDYDLILQGYNQDYNGSAAVEGALAGVFNISDANKDLTGSFNMPSGGGHSEITVLAQVNQPDYVFELNATESITGAQIQGGIFAQQYAGYTGDTFNYTIQLEPSTDYSSFEITAVTEVGDAAAVSYTIDNTNGRVTGTVTMPQGGGTCELRIQGTAQQTQHTYTVTFEDPYTDTAEWQTITYTGITGSFHATTHPLSFKDPDTNYYITGVSNDNPSNLISTDDETVDQELNIVLASMPQGGGAATVEVQGYQQDVSYSLTVVWSMSESNTSPACYFPSNNLTTTYSQSFSGSAGTTFTATANIQTPLDYDWVGSNPVTITGVSGGSAIQPNTYTSNLSAPVTMPSGGGTITITVTPDIRLAIYTYTATVQTNGSSSSVNQYNEALMPSNANSVSGVNNSNGTVTITYVAPVGATWNDILVAVVANNAVDYNPEITSIAKPGWFTIVENEYSGEGMNIDFQMPSLDPRSGNLNYGTITASVLLSEIQHTFNITYADSISNVSPSSPTTVSYTGAVGDPILFTKTYTATSGYEFNITGVSKSGLNASSVTLTDTTGTNIGGSISMPSGGGSATLTATGTSNLTTYDFTITWQNNVTGADWTVNNADTYIETVTLAPGNQTFLMQQVEADAGREIDSLVANSNNSSVVVTDYDESDGIVQIRVTMPVDANGNQSGTVTTTGSTVSISRTLTVNYNESITGAHVSGSPTGAGITQENFTGSPSSTSSVTRYLVPESGYDSPVITSMSDDSSFIYNLSYGGGGSSSGSGSGLVEGAMPFSYSYQIPSSNTSGTITINGSVNTNCETCTFLYNANSPSTYGGSDGTITISIPAGPCSEATFSIEPTATQRPVEFGIEFIGLTAGTYSVAATQDNGCVDSQLIVVPEPATTTQSTSYYYYNATLCPDGFESVILRSTSQWFSGDLVTLSGPGGSGLTACVGTERSVSGHDYDISGPAFDDNCDCGPSNDPFAPSDP